MRLTESQTTIPCAREMKRDLKVLRITNDIKKGLIGQKIMALKQGCGLIDRSRLLLNSCFHYSGTKGQKPRNRQTKNNIDRTADGVS
ncbi:hypothetical protein A7K91_10250 [Paenibacillus oryzae]|uniref:Uncharacterized protein n=1 Tax=Paenibacillus oryzae TaxID=1844972 RepID=A0A1A5YRE6_9BACL|nr:hypothetical protein A7K91_10250 [Paenibacillus oryzae]